MTKKIKGKSAKRAVAPPKGVSRKVIVDGSTVLFTGGPKPKVKNLQLVIQKLKGEGYQPITFVDASRRHDVDDKATYGRMVSQGIVQQVPAGTPADRWILEYATKHPEYRVLSSDMFVDWKNEFPWVDDQNRFIRFMIVGGDVMLMEREADRAPEKVDLDLVLYDGSEIAAPPKPEDEDNLIDLRDADDVSEEIDDRFDLYKEQLRTLRIRAYGRRCVPLIKRDVEAIIAGSSEEGSIKISLKKIAPISWKGMFDTYPGVEIILEKEKPPPPHYHCPKCGAEMPAPAAEAPERVKFCPMCGRELRGRWWI